MADSDARLARYSLLDFNSPLSDQRAADLIAGLLPIGGRVVDLGCGWAELLLRVLEAAPEAVGTGIDHDGPGLDRARSNALTRGLADRVELVDGDAAQWPGIEADVTIAIGVSHIWGGTRPMLEAIRGHLRHGDRVVVGEGFWETPPTPEAIEVLAPEPDEFHPLGGLVDLAISCGYRMLAVSTASPDEWEVFESRWCGGIERWLLDHPAAPEAAAERATVDEHRAGWLHGYRGVLGFAYLTLVASDDVPSAPSRGTH